MVYLGMGQDACQISRHLDAGFMKLWEAFGDLRESGVFPPGISSSSSSSSIVAVAVAVL